jgi:hypothetical protein
LLKEEEGGVAAVEQRAALRMNSEGRLLTEFNP